MRKVSFLVWAVLVALTCSVAVSCSDDDNPGMPGTLEGYWKLNKSVSTTEGSVDSIAKGAQLNILGGDKCFLADSLGTNIADLTVGDWEGSQYKASYTYSDGVLTLFDASKNVYYVGTPSLGVSIMTFGYQVKVMNDEGQLVAPMIAVNDTTTTTTTYVPDYTIYVSSWTR